MKRYVMHTLAAAGLIAAAGHACATSNASASMGDLLITLSALNPTDGSKASLSYTPLGVPYVLAGVGSLGDTSSGSVEIKHPYSVPGPVSSQAQTELASANASMVLANNAAGFTSMAATGMAASGTDAYGNYEAGLLNNSNDALFTLSPYSKVTFSVLASTQTKTTEGYNPDPYRLERADSKASINVFGSVNGNFEIDTQEHYSYSGFAAPDNAGSPVSTDSWNGMLSVTFVNYGATATTVEFDALLDVQGQSMALAPVPEPDTYAMLLGGLALLGAVARRRAARP